MFCMQKRVPHRGSASFSLRGVSLECKLFSVFGLSPDSLEESVAADRFVHMQGELDCRRLGGFCLLFSKLEHKGSRKWS